ncbi:MAG: DNA mismatch repair protein MutL [Halobacteriales archaeon SW_8_66_22]|nr:MAG: DNA mismatch repair protein MutL [Halobacteriales archaeon SW_8_66_22]
MTQGTQPEIEQLDSRTVERIAAGEVVERPASVVKELVENSLDADAGRVTVAVEAGGTESIRVTDDGVGMSEDALRRAVEKHTTSKIGDIEDLESGVRTLGFRGEALHAVGAVSRLTITSRPRGGDRGTELTVEGGEIADVSPAGAPEGTCVEVRDLFYNVPARRKYLKQESTEFAHVNRVVTNYALANPDVAVTLEHDGRETFSTTGSGDLRETVLSVYGRDVAENMVDLREADLPDGPLDGVGGLVSDPETTRATREYLSTFVNGRYVTSGAVREAVVDAYGKQLAADRYPFAVIFLDVDPGTVDVNVHPRKMRVRYSNPEEVKRQVRTAIEDALREGAVLRSSAPRGRSAPDQAKIEPSSVSSSSSPSSPSPHQRPSRSPATNDADTQTTLSGDTAHPTTEYDNFPDLRVLGQLHDTYIVAEADDGLILIDQHAADERINYERLKERFEGETTTQALAEPVQLELTAGEAALFDGYQDALARLGFHANRVGDRTVKITTVPALVADSAGPSVIRDVLADLVTGDEAAEQTVEAVADELLSDMACYPSITGNTSLTDGSVVDLLSTLDDCENPWACPHGRPVLIHIDSGEIDDRFERDYPGQ